MSAQLKLFNSSHQLSYKALQDTFDGLCRQNQNAASFWLSGTWASIYLRYWPESDLYGLLEFGDEHHAFACISKGIRRSRLFTLKSLGFNESSASSLRYVTLEDNGVYGSLAGKAPEFMEKALQCLARQRDWDEIRFSALTQSQAQAVAHSSKRLGLLSYEFARRKTYWVNLNQVNTHHGGNYLASLSSNTRQQLRRAIRLASALYGPLRCERIVGYEKQLKALNRLGELHRTRWASTEDQSGFTSESFQDFQREVVRAFASAESAAEGDAAGASLHILELSAGTTLLGYLYNIVWYGHVYFVMSGINYEVDLKCKPGLLCQTLAIEHFLQTGAHTYDFQVGTSQYKESLSSDSDELITLFVWRKRPKLLVEHYLRIASRVLRRTRRQHAQKPANL